MLQSIFVARSRQNPDVYAIVCVWEKKGGFYIFSCYHIREMRFVINELNNKTIILFNLAENSLILANSTYGLVG